MRDCGTPLSKTDFAATRCRSCAGKQRRSNETEEARRTRYRAHALVAYRVARYGSAEPTRTCAECGEAFTTGTGERIRICCSDECTKRRARRGSRDINQRGRKATRITGARYEPVRRSVVLNRDGHKCWICGGDVSEWGGTLHDNLATLDHVIPLVRGGDHTYDNIKTACWVCNTLKGPSMVVVV